MYGMCPKHANIDYFSRIRIGNGIATKCDLKMIALANDGHIIGSGFHNTPLSTLIGLISNDEALMEIYKNAPVEQIQSANEAYVKMMNESERLNIIMQRIPIKEIGLTKYFIGRYMVHEHLSIDSDELLPPINFGDEDREPSTTEFDGFIFNKSTYDELEKIIINNHKSLYEKCCQIRLKGCDINKIATDIEKISVDEEICLAHILCLFFVREHPVSVVTVNESSVAKSLFDILFSMVRLENDFIKSTSLKRVKTILKMQDGENFFDTIMFKEFAKDIEYNENPYVPHNLSELANNATKNGEIELTPFVASIICACRELSKANHIAEMDVEHLLDLHTKNSTCVPIDEFNDALTKAICHIQKKPTLYTKKLFENDDFTSHAIVDATGFISFLISTCRQMLLCNEIKEERAEYVKKDMMLSSRFLFTDENINTSEDIESLTEALAQKDMEKEELQAEIERLKAQIDTLNAEKKRQDKSISLINHDRESLRKKNEQLEGLIDEQREEISELREVINDEELSNETQDEQVDIKKIEEELRKYKFIVVGGHTEILRKMSEAGINYTEYNYNVKDGQKATGDYILAFTRWASHATFYSAQVYSKSTQTKIVFSSKSKSNYEITMREFYEKICKSKLESKES